MITLGPFGISSHIFRIHIIIPFALTWWALLCFGGTLLILKYLCAIIIVMLKRGK